MTSLSSNDIDRLAIHFMVANTPSFVWRAFRADPAVKALALKDTAELVASIKEVNKKASPATSEIVDAYATAIALLLSGREADLVAELAARDDEQPGNLRWLGGLVKLSRESGGTSIGATRVGPSNVRIDLAGLRRFEPKSTSTGGVATVDIPGTSTSSIVITGHTK